MRNLLSRQKGFTLVEVLIASGIVTLVVAASLTAVVGMSFFTSSADMAYDASNIAKARMDELKILNFSDLTDRAAETDSAIDFNGDGKTDFYRTTEIQEDYGGNPYLVRVKVKVSRVVAGVKFGVPVTIESLFANVE
ncbi:MAG: type II secretion system protein [Candidatus Omnitrophota bacterium]